ncbi:MAG: DNA-binding response regulator [Leptolyngbyaceae cyanobacterium bins.302]|nr:DNA-binding response regulator [Leptolyngbyaceae cyanobacterium bins.302]
MITPLRKRTRHGEPYTRLPRIEAKIIELASLSRDELVAHCTIRQKSDPTYVPSECLLYFIRANRSNRADAHFENLYRLLIERILHSFPRGESSDGTRTFLTPSLIREEVIGRFAELLAIDRRDYSEQLDFFEVRFNKALQTMCFDVKEQVWRSQNPLTTLDDQETGEPTAEVERAAGGFDPFDTSKFSSEGYRFALREAINALPPLERRIIVMLQLNFPIYSTKPDVMTIAKALGKSEKTIRTYRDKAYAALRTALTAGETV